jgi:hypothetical protein
MKLFLQVNIRDLKHESYEKPLLAYASSLADDIIGTDLDHASDPYIVDLVLKLIDQSQAVFLLVTAEEGLPLGSVNALLNTLIRKKEKIHTAMLFGKHLMTEKLLKAFGEKFIQESNSDAIKKQIRVFAAPSEDVRNFGRDL